LESFTGTFVEAMHYGLPILTSDLDFARHVCGDAAIYFDPWDPGSIKEAILRLHTDQNLRQELISRGRERLRTEFKGWDEIAADTVNTLENCVAGWSDE
jgi:glycosyltransferase involved in cell wall biosynthesis